MIGELFSFLDSALAWLPWDALRVSCWAVVCGAASMGLYALVSPQRKLKELKGESQAIRKALAAHQGDFAGAWPLIRRNLALSLKNVWLSLAPSLVAGLPVLLVLVWMEGTRSHRLPEPGEEVTVAIQPSTEEVTWEASSQGGIPEGDSDRGSWQVHWPGAADSLVLRDSAGRELMRLPAGSPSPEKGKRDWIDFFFADPDGYLPEDSPVQMVSCHYPPNDLLPFGPSWMRSWWFLFLVVTTAAALTVKCGFKIT